MDIIIHKSNCSFPLLTFPQKCKKNCMNTTVQCSFFFFFNKVFLFFKITRKICLRHNYLFFTQRTDAPERKLPYATDTFSLVAL